MNPDPKLLTVDVEAIEESAYPAEEKFRILLAEDDDSMRETLKELLDRPQRIISPYKNGEEAMEALKNFYFDAVITDLMMPGADGLAVLKQAKEINPEIVVIIMTGYASLDTALQAIRGGAYDYIRKPFKLEELEIVVTNACEKISLTRQNRFLLRQLKEAVNENRPQMPRHAPPEMIHPLPADDPDEEISKWNVLLNQMIPPHYEFKKKEYRDTVLQELEKLIQLRKKGFIGRGEFSEFKKILLRSFQD
jgi:CheY-like chemotaxis protein